MQREQTIERLDGLFIAEKSRLHSVVRQGFVNHYNFTTRQTSLLLSTLCLLPKNILAYSMITHRGPQLLLEAVPGLISTVKKFKNTKPRLHYNLTSKQCALTKTEGRPCFENTEVVLRSTQSANPDESD